MGLIKTDTFVCVDCETTGLDPENNRIIEIAVVVFTESGIIDSFETLIDPEMPIPEESTVIHHITNDMVVNKPKIKEVLPQVLAMIGKHILIGHGILFDIACLTNSCKRAAIPCSVSSNLFLDTLRLARLYGQSPINSLEKLREHFNIAAEGAHRAMNDVLVNIKVFKYLTQNYKTTEQALERLKKPILLKMMPLGKHKGRSFSDIPQEYLRWALNKDFDQDLIFSIRSELKKRKSGDLFLQAGSPFSTL